jgi:hypothetical protein
MAKPRNVIMPVAAALGALSSTTPATDSNAAASPNPTVSQATVPVTQAGQPNTIVSTGKDLLGFTVTEQADGTVVAQHSSHASHASHASHHSHYSGR